MLEYCTSVGGRQIQGVGEEVGLQIGVDVQVGIIVGVGLLVALSLDT